ncbi:MAG TPA: hypothetical protein VL294_11460 [Pseudolysinimonas sp.]|jgi:hypothetical protein|nr:hypothetical protein [Pseudolysinimonas sp.]
MTLIATRTTDLASTPAPRADDAKGGPIFTLDVRCDSQIVRRMVVLAPSPEGALVKGYEQLDEGETLTFCLPGSGGQVLGLPQTSGVYARR